MNTKIETVEPLKLGEHTFRQFDGVDAAFGAGISDYPPYASIPEEYTRHSGKFNDVASSLFFKGGKLEDYGLRLKSSTDKAAFFGTLRSLLCSFAPKHEHKEATCAWLLAEYTEPAA